MKIAVIGFSWNPYFNYKVVGGLQLVERDHLRLLAANGHEVHHITNTDSEEWAYEHQIIQHRTVPSRFTPEGQVMGTKRSRIRKEMIVALLNNIQPDIVINHDDMNGSLLKTLTKLPYPAVTFLHSSVKQCGGPGLIGYMQAIAEFANAGHTPIAVSDYSRAEWQEQLEKSSKYVGQFADPIFQEVCWPAVTWAKPEIPSTVEHGFVTVGRPDKFKNHRWAVRAVKNLQLFTTVPKNDAEAEVFKELQTLGANIVLDAPYATIMDYISKSKALIFSGYETFGLTSVEANIHGTPVIIASKKSRHTGQEACSLSTENYVIVDPKELESLTSNWDSSRWNRKKIQENCWNTFNPVAAYERLYTRLETARFRFEQKRQSESPMYLFFAD